MREKLDGFPLKSLREGSKLDNKIYTMFPFCLSTTLRLALQLPLNNLFLSLIFPTWSFLYLPLKAKTATLSLCPVEGNC